MDTGRDFMIGQSAVIDQSAPTQVKRILALGRWRTRRLRLGVLDRLLEDERIELEGISATSAGAMNATVMTYGYLEGGRNGAKQALTGFWRRIAHAAQLSPSRQPGGIR